MKKYVPLFEEYQMLLESSFSSFRKEDILTDKYLNDFIRTYDAIDGYLSWYIESEKLDDDNKDEIQESPGFREFMRDILYENLVEAMDNIYGCIDYHTNKITIYREITVDDNWFTHLEKQGKHLGIYWSWDEHAAEAHWADREKKNTAMIKAEIDEKYVDWVETLRLNMHPNYFEEKEIRLFKNTELHIESIEINGEAVDISPIENKKVIA